MGRSFWNLRSVLVAGQLAVSTMLLATGILFVRNLANASSMNPGFDLEQTVWSYMRLVPERYTSPDRVRTLSDAALERLEQLPGVDSAAMARVVPLNGNTVEGTHIQIDDGAESTRVTFRFNLVGPGYFHTMGIPLLSGREFQPAERGNSPTVAILNQALAQRLFGDRNPIGHAIRRADSPPVTIIGVAKNSKYFTLGERDVYALYESDLESNDSVVNLNFLIRTRRRPSRFDRGYQPCARPARPDRGYRNKAHEKSSWPRPPAELRGRRHHRQHWFSGRITGRDRLVWISALHHRTEDTRDRLASRAGATRRDVIRMVLAQGLALTAAGIALGLAIAWFATKPLAAFLVPELSPSDPVSFFCGSCCDSSSPILASFASGTASLEDRSNGRFAIRIERCRKCSNEILIHS